MISKYVIYDLMRQAIIEFPLKNIRNSILYHYIKQGCVTFTSFAHNQAHTDTEGLYEEHGPIMEGESLMICGGRPPQGAGAPSLTPLYRMCVYRLHGSSPRAVLPTEPIMAGYLWVLPNPECDVTGRGGRAHIHTNTHTRGCWCSLLVVSAHMWHI